MWHSNYPYWEEVLLSQQNFPAVKISNRWFYLFLKKKHEDKHNRCLSFMDKSNTIRDLAQKFDKYMDNGDSINQLQYRMGCERGDSMC